MNTIYILWLRQIKRYMRSRARIVVSLAQPVLFFIAFGFGMGPIFERAGEGDYIQFLAPGIIAMTVMFSSVLSGIDLIWDKQFGFLKETLVAPVSRTKILVGRVLGATTISLFQGLLVFALTIILGFRPENIFMLPMALLFMGLIALFFTTFGTALASLINDMHAFPMVINLIAMPLFFLSGALFPIENFPKAIKFISMIDPLSYGVDGLRYSMAGMTSFGLFLDFVVLIICIGLTMAVGVRFFKRIEI